MASHYHIEQCSEECHPRLQSSSEGQRERKKGGRERREGGGGGETEPEVLWAGPRGEV